MERGEGKQTNLQQEEGVARSLRGRKCSYVQQVLRTSTKNPCGVLVPQVYTASSSVIAFPFTLYVSKGHSTPQVVLLYTRVTSLGCRIPHITTRNVHADHVPKVALNGATVVVGGSSRWMWKGLLFDHGHYWAGLLRTAAVRHRTEWKQGRNLCQQM